MLLIEIKRTIYCTTMVLKLGTIELLGFDELVSVIERRLGSVYSMCIEITMFLLNTKTAKRVNLRSQITCNRCPIAQFTLGQGCPKCGAQQVFAVRDWPRDLQQVSFEVCKFFIKKLFFFSRVILFKTFKEL